MKNLKNTKKLYSNNNNLLLKIGKVLNNIIDYI